MNETINDFETEDSQDTSSTPTVYSQSCFTKIETLSDLNVSVEPFFFESDSLALRNNPDYSCLLKTLVLLEAQRIKACNDIETLIDLKEEALNEPTKFVNELRRKDQNKPGNYLSRANILTLSLP